MSSAASKASLKSANLKRQQDNTLTTAVMITFCKILTVTDFVPGAMVNNPMVYDHPKWTE